MLHDILIPKLFYFRDRILDSVALCLQPGKRQFHFVNGL